jgi:hypothetical protein
MTEKSSLIDATRTKDARTENQALTHSTSLDSCVDLFFIAGASRRMAPDRIVSMFEAAYGANPSIALKILFWARDVRGGAGERRFFRVIWEHIYNHRNDVFKRLYELVPEYGRWDDLFYSEDFLTTVAAHLHDKLLAGDRLLAKWLPRKGQRAKILREQFGMSPKQYRKTLVEYSDTVEQAMCEKQWSSINYEKVPSVAMHKYRSAFLRNDETRFRQFLGEVTSGEKTIHADVLFPHQLYQAWYQGKDAQSIVAQWNALPDYMEQTQERILPMCDVSGSMRQYGGLEMAVSVALGVYISERNEGIFKDAFVTFSRQPEMQYLKGDLISRFNSLRRAHWDMNTNLKAAFMHILQRAVQENVPENQMPTMLLIISDMEFDQAVTSNTRTNLDEIKRLYTMSGYTMPKIVFWNVRGRQGNVPAAFDESGIGLVSGFSPSILKGILGGELINAEQLMLRVVNSERYQPIA